MATKNIQHSKILAFITSVLGDSFHGKQIQSLSNAVQGVTQSCSLALSMISAALASAQGLNKKHALKQVDRLFSNAKINLDVFFFCWVTYLVQAHRKIAVSLDWTVFSKDAHSTLTLNLITKHGRATPLIWKTYDDSTLKNHRGEYEEELLKKLHAFLPATCMQVIILADRGFGAIEFYQFIISLGFDFIIRFKGNTNMTVKGVTKPAKEWLRLTAHLYREVGLTLNQYIVRTVVCVHDKKMKDAWYLASSIESLSTRQITSFYGRRFTCEEDYRDIKNIRYGMGLSSVHIKNPERRDRYLLVAALSIVLLTLLGAAGEAIGLDRLLKSNTVKTRTHSLFNQGNFYFSAMANYTEEKFKSLMASYSKILDEFSVFRGLFGHV
jgi:Transposase DDE domain